MANNHVRDLPESARLHADHDPSVAAGEIRPSLTHSAPVAMSQVERQDGLTRPHGRTKYVVEKCRCDVCRKAACDYERWRTRQRAYGRAAYVDAEPVRAHVRALQAEGMGWKRVARKAGIGESVVWKLIYGCPQRNMGPSKRVRPATAAAILAVTVDLDALGATVCVDATGTHRRIQALVTVGWSMSKVAVRIGVAPTNLPSVLHRPLVHAETARKVRDLYDELWKVAPPESNQRDRIAAARARNYAAARGWKPPLWWDEDAIDRPVIEDVLHDLGDDLDAIAVERAMRGENVALTKPERLEAVRLLLASGINKTEVGRRLRLSGATVDTLLAQLQETAA